LQRWQNIEDLLVFASERRLAGRDAAGLCVGWQSQPIQKAGPPWTIMLIGVYGGRCQELVFHRR
jgi:hypothetical protein